MATNEDVKAKIKDDMQETARGVMTGVEIAAGVRNEIIETGGHILKGVTAPVQEAISQGPATTLAYVNSLNPASHLSNAAETLTKAALGDEAAQAEVRHAGDKTVDIAEAFPKGLGENVARGELAAKAGDAYAFGGALGAVAMMSVTGPEGKAAEAAVASGVTRAVEGELVDSAVAGSQQIAAASAENAVLNSAVSEALPSVVPAVENSTTAISAAARPAPAVSNIVDPKHNPVANALENSNLPDQAKKVLSPVASILDEAKSVVMPPKPTTLTEHMNHEVLTSYKREQNVIFETLDRHDATHIDARTGLTIAEATRYNQWNKEQVATRAQFYNDVFQHRPEIAAHLEQQGITHDGVKNLLMSDVNDHLMGIKPYEGYQTQGYVHGYEADRALAKEWGIEYKEQKTGWGGVLQDLTGKNEITLNKELQEAKKAVAAAEALQTAVHQDTAKRILIPELPRNAELDAKVQQLLAVKLEDGTLSVEARQALPAELRALPAKHLETLQEKAQQAVATDHLRLSAERQATPLIGGSGQGAAKAETNVVASDYTVMSKAILDSFSQSLSAVHSKAPVAEIVPLTEAQIAAKQKVAEFTEGKGTVAKTTRFVIDTAAGYSGVGYNFGQRELASIAEKAAISDSVAMKALVETGLRKTATTLAVAGTAVVAPAALPVGFAAVVATRMVANNETAMAAIKGTAEAVKDYVVNTANNLRPSTQRDALVETLAKDANGALTPQSQQVLQMVDQRMADAQLKAPDIPPEIGR